MDQILMLNAAYVPVGLVNWMAAVRLLVNGRAEVVVPGVREVRSPSVTLRLPSILRLGGRARFPQRTPRLTRRNLLARDEHTCQYCQRRLPASRLNMDHVVPRSRGGSTTWENIVTACIPCNTRKGARTPEQAGMRLLRRPFLPRWTIGQEIRRTTSGIPEAWKPFLPESRR